MRVFNNFFFFLPTYFAVIFLLFLLTDASHSDNSKQQSYVNKYKKYGNQDRSAIQPRYDEWQIGKKYTYHVHARTLSTMGGQQNGVVVHAKLQMIAVDAHEPHNRDDSHQNNQRNDEENKRVLVQGWVKNVKFGTQGNEYDSEEIYTDGPLPNGINWRPYPGLETRFDVVMKGGLVESLYIPKNMKKADANLLRGFLSALQYDTSSRHLQGRNGFLHESESQGVFKKMEKDVTGKCKTLYTVSPLPRDELQRNSYYAQLLNASETDARQLLQITKTKDHGSCDSRVAYHFGVPRGAYWEDTAKDRDNFMSRTTSTKLIVDRKNNTIYSTSYKSVVSVNPVFNKNKDASVISSINMTLTSVKSAQDEHPPKIDNPKRTNLRFRIRNDDASNDGNNNGSNEESNSASNEGSNSASNESKKNKYAGSKQNSGSSSEEKNNSQQDSHQRQYSQNQKSGSYRNKRSAEYKDDDNSRPSLSSRQEDSRENSNESSDKWLDNPSMHNQIRTGRTNSPSEQKKTVDSIARMTNDIAYDLQKYYKLAKKDILERWNIIVKKVQTLDSEHLEKLTEKMYQKSNEQSKLAWKLYRDAVAQSGTGPAYREIKAWISSRKIAGEEAAQVISSLPKTLRNPTKKLMYDFFNFAISQEVQDQKYLNTSALLSITKLINRAHVDNSTVHGQYPVHLYGRMIASNNSIVTDRVLPYLEEQLKNAVRKNDSHKAQVYVSAIGNLAHPAIIKSFGPYFEGRKPVSTFLRTHMTMSLKKYAMQFPHDARNVLFNIFQNHGENYEVRVAAVHQLMKSHPTPSMLQKMAISTNTDPNHQVRSAVKSYIQNAASQNNDQDKKLARNAQSAQMLLSERNYGIQYSKTYMNDGQFQGDIEGEYREIYSQIGSTDSSYPKNVKYFYQRKNSAWMGHTRLHAAISSVGQLIELIEARASMRQEKQNKDIKSAQDIADELKIKGQEQEPLEGHVRAKLYNQDRFFTFNEDTINNAVSELMKEISNDKYRSFNYTKVLNTETVTIVFPMAMGVPFVFEYNTPTMIRINGDIKTEWKSKPASSFVPNLNVKSYVDLHYATAIDGRAGFIDRLNNNYRHFAAGVMKKLEVRIPLNVSAKINMFDQEAKLQIQSLEEERDVNVFHMSSWPYTTVYQRDSEKPVSQHKNTTVIKNPRPERSGYKIVGQKETGLAFILKSQYDDKSRSRNPWNRILENYPIAGATAMLDDGDNTQFIYSVTHSPSKSSTRKVKLTLEKHQINKQDKGSALSDQKQYDQNNSRSSNSGEVKNNGDKDFIKNLMQKTGSEIRQSDVWAIQAEAKFGGKQENKFAKYSLEVLHATSRLDNDRKGFVWASKNNVENEQYKLDASYYVKSKKAPLFNFNDALDFDPSVFYDVNIKYGSKEKPYSRIEIQGKMEQTKQRKEFVRNEPESEQCRQEMKNGNLIMPACENATIQANLMDKLHFVVKYENPSDSLKNMTHAIYRKVRHLAWDYHEEDRVSNQGKENQVELHVRLSPELDAMNVSLSSPNSTLHLKDVPFNGLMSKIAVPHPNVNFLELTKDAAYEYQANGRCSVDVSAINTFSNKTFNYKIDSCWHALMFNGTSYTHEKPSVKQSYVLMRRTSGNDKTVRIYYRNNNGEAIKVELDKNNIDVQTGLKSLQKKTFQKNDGEVLWNQDRNRKLLEYYTLFTGEHILIIDHGELVVEFDGQRVRLTASDSYRNNTRGVCGAMSNEPNDLIAPGNCYYRSKQHFAASYVHSAQKCKDLSQELHEEAKKAHCRSWEQKSSSLFNDYYNQEYNRFSNQRYPGSKSDSSNYSDPWDNADSSDNSNAHSESKSNSDSNESDEQSNQRSKKHQTYQFDGYKRPNSYGQSEGCAMQRQVQYAEYKGMICITQMPLPACPQQCKPKDEVNLPARMVCRPQNNEEYIENKKQIENGKNPKVYDNANYQIIYRVPQSCY